MRQETLIELFTYYSAATSLEDRLTAAKKILNFLNKTCQSPSSNKLNRLEQSVLYNFWEYLKPDCIQRRQDVNLSETMYQLHCVSLQLLQQFNQKPLLFMNSQILTLSNIHVIIDLLSIQTGHETCCFKALEANWDSKTKDRAEDLMCGRIFDALFGDIDCEVYNVHLLDSETGENIVDILSRECSIERNNLSVNLKSPSSFSETVKVVYVVSPQFVWVQDHTDDIQEINEKIAEHLELSPKQAVPSDLSVIVKLKKLNFRGQVLNWQDPCAVVFAIDYGWQVEVPSGLIFQTEDHISETPPLAKLCKIVNVAPPCKKTKLQVSVIKLLQTVTYSEPFTLPLLNSYLEPVLTLLCNSRNANLVCNILLYFSQLCFFKKNAQLQGEKLLKPTLACIRKWFFCIEVLAQGFEVMRNLMASSKSSRENFINLGGLEVAMNTYAVYSKEKTVHDHVLHVLKFCLAEYEFETNVYQTYSIEDVLSSGNLSEKKNIFTHLSSMCQYNVEPSNSVSFIDNIINQQDLLVFARELVSYLNSPNGGTIYIGVNYQGLINGLLMNRSRKDEYRTKIDMVISKMVCDYKLTELPNQLVECSFEGVSNIHNRAMPDDASMYLIKVTITPGRTLSRLRDGEAKVFFKRNHGRVEPISANELRQYVATLALTENSPISFGKRDVNPTQAPTPVATAAFSAPSAEHIPTSAQYKPDKNFQEESAQTLSFDGPPPLVPVYDLH